MLDGWVSVADSYHSAFGELTSGRLSGFLFRSPVDTVSSTGSVGDSQPTTTTLLPHTDAKMIQICRAEDGELFQVCDS
jgi:hypothetical protein